MKLKLVCLFFVFISLSACADRRVEGLDPSVENAAVFATEEKRPENTNDPLREQLGSFFLVEQFSVNINSSMLKAIETHTPGGIVFWNGNSASASTVRNVISAYAARAQELHKPNILFSTDYEGGDLKFTPRGSSIIGIQRFRNGFTSLAHPVWLGQGTTEQSARLCYLHGLIIAKEMASVGLNYPLSVVSDLSKRLFLNRGISKDPNIAAHCLKNITDGFTTQKNVIFVTKHFPGLASTNGDTHDQVAKSDASLEELQNHILPFKETIAHVNQNNSWPLYSIMSGHGSYPLLDESFITTESRAIVTDLLRTDLKFKGIAVSDAMWMGNYGTLGKTQLMAVYLNTFLAGADLLMIPGSQFATAMDFFRDVYDNEVSDNQKSAILKRIGGDWESLHAQFLIRIKESLHRFEAVREKIVHAPSTGLPKENTVMERAEYYELLNAIDVRWKKRLPND